MSIMNDPDRCTKCEHCGAPWDLDSNDYCAKCSKNLCDACMRRGHCGDVPAKSGLEEEATYQIISKPRPKR